MIMKTKHLVLTSVVSLFALAAGSGRAQIGYDGTALNYAQNFDSLGTVNLSWVDGSTLPGWYMQCASATYGSSGVPITLTAVQAGGQSTAQAYNVGSNGVNSASDRALGWVTGSATSTAYTGFQLQNNSGQAFAGTIGITYTIEQYSAKNAASDPLISAYKVVASSGSQLTSSSYTTLSTINSPNTSNTGGAIDGNAAGNRVTITDTITFTSGSPWNSGYYVWFRLRDTDISGNDELNAVDDVSITIPALEAVPEPAAGSLFVLAGLLCLNHLQRRKR